ncbi:SsgA family sporulation/cell division regulator [Streptomyces sp. NPDC050658]|uniref:SsgA family sporulation/cell division regulator n=1 Tax=unclassified Streptomyces TaxID=2593676 RepID=UPI003413EA0F
MHVTLESSAGASLVTRADQEIAVPVLLRYGTAEPDVVHLDFPAHVTVDGEAVTWSLPRDLRSEGLAAPTRHGQVRVRPSGEARTLVELHAPAGAAALRFDSQVLHRFLLRTHAVLAHTNTALAAGNSPAGRESGHSREPARAV